MRIQFLIYFILCSSYCYAQNLNFEEYTVNNTAIGWKFSWQKGYNVQIDTEEKKSGSASIRLESIDNGSTGRTFIAYSIPVNFKGKELEIRAYLKSENLNTGGIMANLSQNDINVDSKTAFTNGTNSWKQYSIKMPLPSHANTIQLVVGLWGNGRLWADDFEILIDGKEYTKAEKTAIPQPEIPVIFNKLKNPIKENCIALHSITPTDTNYTDLLELKKMLNNKRIILLGEASHGDGAAFLAKTRLIKFLHEEMGFNTLALEGGDIFKMNPVITSYQDDAFSKLQDTWYPIWLKEETIDLAKFIQHSYQSTPLKLFGFDSQLDKKYSYDFVDSLKSICLKDKKTIIDNDFWNRLSYTINTFKNQQDNYYYQPENERSTIHLQLYAQMDSLDIELQKQYPQEKEQDEMDLYRLCIQNAKTDLMGYSLFFGTKDERNESIAIRDEQMAKNLFWYLDKYPNEKVIVWAANLHIAHDLNNVIYEKDSGFYKMFKPLGHYIKEKYQNQAYSLAVMGIGGTSGLSNAADYITLDNRISKDDYLIPVNSLSNLVAKTISDSVFIVNFEGIRNASAFKNATFNDQLLGYQMHWGAWFTVFDGVLYLKNMCYSTNIRKEYYPIEYSLIERKRNKK